MDTVFNPSDLLVPLVRVIPERTIEKYELEFPPLFQPRKEFAIEAPHVSAPHVSAPHAPDVPHIPTDANHPTVRGPSTATFHPDGHITVTRSDGITVDIQVGDRGTIDITSTPPPEQVARQQEKATTNGGTDQHAPGEKEKTKSDLLDKVAMGLMLIPALLPLALFLAATIQGGVDCDNLDQKQMNITGVTSSKWPQGLPSWVPTMNANKVDVTYDPCVKILSTDTIKVQSSNVFDGTYSPVSTNGTCSIRIDIGKAYTSNTASNTANFILNTSCSDRMAYELGQDVNDLAQAGGNIAGDLFGGLFGSIPWSAILMILAGIVAIYIAFQAIQIFKKP